MDLSDSWLSGATGGLSILTGGLTPVYGEGDRYADLPWYETIEARQRDLRAAVLGTAETVAADPAILVERTTESIGAAAGEIASRGAGGAGAGVAHGLGLVGSLVALGVAWVALSRRRVW